MKISHLYYNDQNISCFEDIEIEFENKEYGLSYHSFYKNISSDIMLIAADKKTNPQLEKFHSPSTPLMLIHLSGLVESEAGNGEKRLFSAGSPYESILLITATGNGKGHCSRVLEEIAYVLFIALESEKFKILSSE